MLHITKVKFYENQLNIKQKIKPRVLVHLTID